MKTIWGNTIVKDEDRFIWFALMSVIDFLDKILVWDTGSSDKTVEIIKSICRKYPQKIVFKQVQVENRNELTKKRQQMLEETKSDWLFLLDGDEIWWEDSIKKIRQVIQQKGDDLDFLVNPTYNLIGDIYHYQEKQAGKYEVVRYQGHLNIRAVNRKIPGLHIDKPYPDEGFFDDQNRLIQERDRNRNRILFVDAPYLHATHLQRSSNQFGERGVIDRSKKRKYELGIPFSKDFKFPEVFYQDFPAIVSSPWVKMDFGYKIMAALQTPFRKLKRRIQK